MPFHRYSTPTYFGGLIAGHDYLNDPQDPSVGGTGDPAIVDPIKSGGPNDGSYFCCFREDGRSGAVNRGLGALGENTDTLDDILRTSIPVIIFVDGTAVGATATVALTGQIYVGESGTANNQTTRDKIIRVTDQSNNDLEVSGAKVVATLIHDGANNNVVGTQASGFRTNASVTFTPSIPNGTLYRVWYGIRDNLANISGVNKGAYFEEAMRTIQNVSGEVRSLLRQIHSETSVNQAWDAPFDSTIRSLAASGLNERYRRATLQPAGFVTGDFNVAGSGGSIFRDGPAITIINDEISSTSAVFTDPNHSSFKVVSERPRDNNFNALSDNTGGAVGYWHEIEWRSKDTTDSSQVTRGASQGPALVEVIPRDIRADAYGADTHLTRISPVDATATLNPNSGAGATDRKTVECAAGQYFSLTGPTRTAIRCGIDLLEITRPDTTVQTYIIESILANNRITVKGFAGGDVVFPTTALAGCSIRWLQVVTSIGGRLQQDSGGGGLFTRPLLCMPPGIGTTVPANELVGPCAFFGSQTGSVTDATAEARRARALEWGSTASPDSGGTVNGQVTPRGWLNGDGSVRCTMLTSTGDATIADDLDVGDDAAVGGDMVVGALTTTRAFRQDEMERYFLIREDWTRFVQTFTPDFIIADEVWDFDEVSGTFTLNNGTPTSKNPGQLQIIGAGGSSTRELSIRKTNLLPVAFANLEMMTIIVKVSAPGANLADSISIGLVDDTASQAGGDDSIVLFLSRPTAEWRLLHRKGAANGANNQAVLSAFTANQFIVFRLLKNAAGNLEIYINNAGSPTVTIAAANIPDGLGTFSIYAVQTVADADPTIFTVDFCGVRALTSTNRAGA